MFLTSPAIVRIYFYCCYSPYVALQDAPEACQMGFQDPDTPVMPEIIGLEQAICLLIIALFLMIIINIFLLSYIYCCPDPRSPLLKIDVRGRQHNWSYKYSLSGFEDLISSEFDSLPVEFSQSNLSGIELYSTMNHLVVPRGIRLKFTFTWDDIAHTWCVPSLNIYGRAVFCRSEELFVTFWRPGVHCGGCVQCTYDPIIRSVPRGPAPTPPPGAFPQNFPLRRSCHSIIVQVVSLRDCIDWIRNQPLSDSVH